MTPAGNTNVTIGLQMAWQTLSNNAPFNAPAPATDEADQAAQRRAILERLARKEIGAEEAAEALRELGAAG